MANLMQVPGFSKVPASQFLLYKQLAKGFVKYDEEQMHIATIEKELQIMRDF